MNTETAPRLATAPRPEPRPRDPVGDAADRAWGLYFDGRDVLLAAFDRIDELERDLAYRDATIAALEARVGARGDICWGLGVALLIVVAIVAARWLGGL
jgi:hypothetical protein